jgi:hypothetical protein
MPEPESTTPGPEVATEKRFLRLGPRAWLAGLLGFAFFYFYSGGGPNQASRFDLDRALLEHGKVSIDEYHGNTIDKAFFKGHHYSEKAPGSSLAALPALAWPRVALRFVGIDPVSNPGLLAPDSRRHGVGGNLARAVHVSRALSTGPSAAAYSRKGAAFAALALGLTSPIWAYATLFWGHVLAACCLLYGAKGVMTLAQQPPAKGATRMALLAGLATGGPWSRSSRPRRRRCSSPWPWCAGCGRGRAGFANWQPSPQQRQAAALVLGAYNKVAFGSPFHLGYASVQGFDGMRSGLFGVTRPRAEALRGLLIGPRSLLYTSPLLVLGLLGHGISMARARQRWTAILSLIVIVYSSCSTPPTSTGTAAGATGHAT